MIQFRTYNLKLSDADLKFINTFNLVNVQGVFDYLYTKLFNDNQRINHLSGKINRITNQDPNKKQIIELYNFLIDRLEKQNQRTPTINSSQDLRKYIFNLIENQLEFEIREKQKYFNYWQDEKFTIPKRETPIQQDIENTLAPYCNGIGIHREPLSGNGFIDFLFEFLDYKVCLEVKLADHNDVTTAIKTQLPKYLKSKRTKNGIYLVFWHKNTAYKQPAKYASILELEHDIELNKPKEYEIDIKVIDCTKPISPSKTKLNDLK